MYISGKIFMKIRLAFFVWSGAPLLVFGGSMRSTDDFQNIMRCSATWCNMSVSCSAAH